jgi:hypothetical protein
VSLENPSNFNISLILSQKELFIPSGNENISGVPSKKY